MPCQDITDSNYYRLVLSHIIFENIYKDYNKRLNEDEVAKLSGIEQNIPDLLEEVNEIEVNEIA